MAKKRYTVNDLPSYIVNCPIIQCVYNENGQCDDPRTGKGNSDATCSLWSNKHLLQVLGLLDEKGEWREAL